MSNYRKAHFDPESPKQGRFAAVQRPGDAGAPPTTDWAYSIGRGTARDPRLDFVFAEPAVLALNVAMATGRPLLVSGEPGSGKTSLARFAALAMDRRFYRETVTSRTQAATLQSSFDTLRRLSDAQQKGTLKPEQAYVLPGILWWVLQPQTAAQRGIQPLAARWKQAPGVDPGIGGTPGGPAVLLLDEIDKADPDVPNDLLEVLDERGFTVPETGERIEAPKQLSRDRLLIVMTTNDERELPPAFMRRCVTLTLPAPTQGWLVDIAQRRFGPGTGPFEDPLYHRLAQAVMAQRQSPAALGRRPPSTSEFVDAVAACRSLLHEGWLADDGGAALQSLLSAVIDKRTAPGSAA